MVQMIGNSPMQETRLRHLSFVPALLLVVASTAADEYRPQRVLRPQPTITEFEVRSAQEVGQQLADNELVLGVTVNGQSRAYPINMLTGPRREIINDDLGGSAIAATW